MNGARHRADRSVVSSRRRSQSVACSIVIRNESVRFDVFFKGNPRNWVDHMVQTALAFQVREEGFAPFKGTQQLGITRMNQRAAFAMMKQAVAIGKRLHEPRMQTTR